MEREYCFLCNSEDPSNHCQKCQKNQCQSCVGAFKLQAGNSRIICSICSLISLNMTKRVVQEFIVLPVKFINATQLNIFLPVSREFQYNLQQESQVEIRCIKLDHRGPRIMGECTFPDSCSIRNSGGKPIQVFHKLDTNSSLKKRRDNPIPVKKELFKKMLLQREKLQVQMGNCFDNKNSFSQDRSLIIYLWGIFEFFNQSFDQIQLDRFYQNQSNIDSFEFIKRISQSQLPKAQEDPQESFVQINGVEFALADSLTQQKMAHPGRGAYCQHVSCFDIQSYLRLIQNSQHVKQYCPLCSLPLGGLIMDSLQQTICQQNQSEKTTIQIDNISQIGSLEEMLRIITLKIDQNSLNSSVIQILSEDTSKEDINPTSPANPKSNHPKMYRSLCIQLVQEFLEKQSRRQRNQLRDLIDQFENLELKEFDQIQTNYNWIIIMERKLNGAALGKSLLCGGVALVTGLSYIYASKFRSNKKGRNVYSREQIIRTLRDLRKEFQPIFREIRLQISISLNRIQQMSRGQGVPQQYLLELRNMVEQDPRTIKQLERAEDAAYERNEIYERKAFEEQVRGLSKTDPEIKELSLQIRTSYEKSLNGQYELLSLEYPKEITPELAFDIKKNILKLELREILGFILKLREVNPRVDLQNIEVRQGLEIHVQEKLQGFQYPALLEFTEDYYPSTIHSQLLIRFADSDKKFEEKLLDLQEFKQGFLMGIQNGTDQTVLEDELDKIDAIMLIEPKLIVELPQESTQQIQHSSDQQKQDEEIEVIETSFKEQNESPQEIDSNKESQQIIRLQLVNKMNAEQSTKERSLLQDNLQMNQNESSLREPVMDTIKRDLSIVINKTKFYLQNERQNEEEIKRQVLQYDLQGPLLFFLAIATCLALEKGDQSEVIFSTVIFFLTLGTFIQITNLKLLGVRINYFQGISLFGYILSPFCLASFFQLIFFFLPKIIQLLISLSCGYITYIICSRQMSQIVPPKKLLLAMLPFCMFLFLMVSMMIGN